MLKAISRKMRAFRKKFDMITDSLIDVHLNKKSNGDFVPKDVIDGLLQIADDRNLEVKLTRDCLKALIMVLMMISFIYAFHCHFSTL